AFNAAIPRFVPEQGATVFFVKLAPPTCANIGLGAFHFILTERLATELDAAVFFIGREFYFHHEAEIFEKRFALQEFVMLQAGRCAAHDFTVLDRKSTRLNSSH